MASDPDIREAVLRALQQCGGKVTGASYGNVAAKLQPQGASVAKTKLALNSLAHSTKHPRVVKLARRRPDVHGMPGEVVVTALVAM